MTFAVQQREARVRIGRGLPRLGKSGPRVRLDLRGCGAIAAVTIHARQRLRHRVRIPCVDMARHAPFARRRIATLRRPPAARFRPRRPSRPRSAPQRAEKNTREPRADSFIRLFFAGADPRVRAGPTHGSALTQIPSLSTPAESPRRMNAASASIPARSPGRRRARAEKIRGRRTGSR